MTTFKIGDKVYIKDSLVLDQEYGEDIFCIGMKKGCEATIIDIDCGGFRLSGCSSFRYTPEMLDIVPETIEDKVQTALSGSIMELNEGSHVDDPCTTEQGEGEGTEGKSAQNKESEEDGEGEPKEGDKESEEENKDSEGEEKQKKKRRSKEEMEEDKKKEQEEKQKKEEEKQEQEKKEEEEKQKREPEPIVNNIHEMNIIEKAVEANIPTLLVGETGTGKTTIVRAVAQKHKKQLVRINLNGQTGREELIGKYVLLGGETIWQDGPLVVGLKMGAWILLDEINAALPEVLFVIQALAESNHGKLGDILLAEKDGEVVVPHPDCRLFGTANPADKYVGTKEFNPATLSRFLMLEIHVLPQAEEKKLLKDKFPTMSGGTIQKLTEIGRQMRQKYSAEEIAYFCSTRDLVYMAELVNRGLSETDAFEVVVMNKIQTKIEKELVIRDLKSTIDMPNTDYDKFENELESIKQLAKEAQNIVKDSQLVVQENNRLKNQIETLQHEYTKLESKQSKMDELRKLLS